MDPLAVEGARVGMGAKSIGAAGYLEGELGRGSRGAEPGGGLAVVGRRPPADLAAAYREEAGRIVGAALTDVEGWEKIDHLATIIGHRLSGSAALEQAIDWAAGRMGEEGLAVRKQSVMVPHWVRGRESAAVITTQSNPRRASSAVWSADTSESRWERSQ